MLYVICILYNYIYYTYKCAVTYPLDLTKTRLQIQGEQAHKVADGHGKPRGPKSSMPHRGMLATASGIGNHFTYLFIYFILLCHPSRNFSHGKFRSLSWRKPAATAVMFLIFACVAFVLFIVLL